MRHLLQRILLLIPSVVMGFLLVEIIVRTFFPQVLFRPRSDIWTPVPAFGYRHVANADVTVFGEKIHFVTDSHGYRIDSSYPEDRCEPEVRILMLGDSFLEALGIEEDRTISALATRRLERDLTACVRIDNAGVSGWNPNHYYMEARDALERESYDVGVVFVYIGNDIITAQVDSFPPRPVFPKRELRFPKSFGGGEIADAWLKPVNDFLRARSHFYIMFRKRLHELATKSVGKSYFPEINRKEMADAPSWQITASVCEKIKDEFHRNDVPVFFVLIPVFYQVVTHYLEENIARSGVDPSTVDANQPNTILRREFDARNMMVLDPLEVMKEKTAQGVDMYDPVDPHFTDEANEFITDYIIPTITLLLEEPPAVSGDGDT